MLPGWLDVFVVWVREMLDLSFCEGGLKPASSFSRFKRLTPQKKLTPAGFRISDLGFGVSCSVFWVSDSRFRVSGFGFRDSRLGFQISCSVFRVSGSGFRVSVFVFWILDFGFQVSGSRFQVSSFVFWIAGVVFWIPGFRLRVPGFGFQVSGFGFRASHVVEALRRVEAVRGGKANLPPKVANRQLKKPPKVNCKSSQTSTSRMIFRISRQKWPIRGLPGSRSAIYCLAVGQEGTVAFGFRVSGF